MSTYLVTVNGVESSVSKEEAEAIDMVAVNATHFHLLQNQQAFNIEVLPTVDAAKVFKIKVNGNTYDLKIEDDYDQQVKKMGMLTAKAIPLNEIKVPMPGLVVNILVEEGQMVEKGTPLLVLSAMKMENVILSQSDAQVKAIVVKNGDAVEKGQLVIELE